MTDDFETCVSVVILKIFVERQLHFSKAKNNNMRGKKELKVGMHAVKLALVIEKYPNNQAQ